MKIKEIKIIIGNPSHDCEIRFTAKNDTLALDTVSAHTGEALS